METPDFSHYTILIAEDNDYNFEFILLSLKQTGIRMIRAVNGVEAIQRCQEIQKIDMILMDGMMPEMTGYDAAKEIRKLFPALPIIILTAYVSTTTIREAVLSGCNDFLSKPVGAPELMSIIRKWLDVPAE